MVEKRETSIWEVLSWIAFSLVFLYFFLKVTGVIHSPVTIDLIALVSGAYFVGRYAKKLEYTFKDIKDLKEDITRLDTECPVFEKQRTKTK